MNSPLTISKKLLRSPFSKQSIESSERGISGSITLSLNFTLSTLRSQILMRQQWTLPGLRLSISSNSILRTSSIVSLLVAFTHWHTICNLSN